MLQLRRDLDLALEARGANGGREIVPEHLDRDLAAMLEVLGEVDRRHAAGAELALDNVLADEAGVDLGDTIGHERARVDMRQVTPYP